MNTYDLTGLIKLYNEEKITVLQNFPVREVAAAVEAVISAYESGNTIYACGNGGNAAFVSNLITDLANHPFVAEDKSKPLPEDLKRLRAVDLTASSASITGISNDLGYQYIFSQQLMNDRIRRDDVVFGFTGSGNSANILEAFKTAKKYGALTIGIVKGKGGKTKETADICIMIPGTSSFPGQTGGNDNNFHFEDALSSISHIITGILKQHVENKFRAITNAAS